MPTRPPHRCSGCGQLVAGPCPTCARQTNVLRGSRTARGYDEAWQRLRRVQLSRDPLCRSCAANGLVVIADQVDHIRPFTSLADPRRLDPDNLQSLCARCHARKTRREHTGVAHHGQSTVPNRAGPASWQTQKEGPRCG